MRDDAMSQPSAEADGVVRLSAGDGEAVVALAGGQPIVWRIGGRDLLWSGDPAHWAWHAPVLFPVVGQGTGGGVRIRGRHHAMPRHGFARVSTFRCLERTPDTARLRLEPATADTTFPLPFRLDLAVALKARSLSLEFAVTN